MQNPAGSWLEPAKLTVPNRIENDSGREHKRMQATKDTAHIRFTLSRRQTFSLVKEQPLTERRVAYVTHHSHPVKHLKSRFLHLFN